jgi:hypothetical protein
MNNIVIFSIDTVSQPASDEQRKAIALLLNATPVLGCYKGNIENSFMVGLDKLSLVKELAKTFNQESILVVSDTGHYTSNSRLVFLDTDQVLHLDGIFQEVQSIFGLENYSYINGKIYTVKAVEVE